jgi:hypothetical protein
MAVVFKRLSEVDKADIIELMNHPLVRRHMPLATGAFGLAECDEFVAAKERFWKDYGYGRGPSSLMALSQAGEGLQPERGEVDLGLMLHPKYWGVGRSLYGEIVSLAFGSMGVKSLTVLLPSTRTRVRGVLKMGPRREGEVEIANEGLIRHRLKGRRVSKQSIQQPESAFPKGIAKPALRALAAAGVSRIDQLAKFTESELRAMHGMGPKAIGIIKAELRKQGKALGKES